MSYDDDLDDDLDQSDTWVPPPPPDDEYEDPNPRAAPPVSVEPVRLAPVIPLRSKRQQQEERLATRMREILDESGVTEVMGVLLEQIAQEPALAQTTCGSCEHPMAPFYGRCPRCEGNRNRQRVERLAEFVRELKSLAVGGDPDPEREREIIAQLREYDHPDIDGLTRWCSITREKADRGGARDAGKSKRW